MPNEFDPYACEIGTALWEAYRREHPDAPLTPPESAAELPDATAYWAHSNTCDDCNEV